MRLYFSIAFLLIGFLSHSQYSLSGKITDANGNPLVGAHIQLGNTNTFSDTNGNYSISALKATEYRLLVSYLGFISFDETLNITANKQLNISLEQDNSLLENIEIHGVVKQLENKQQISSNVIQQNYSGSLIQSLENVAGINAMTIGSGASKPIIRGFGFNRVVVAQNGNKHEGQQWGADHQLEIDAFSVEQVELIKGAASIEYGNEAIGGVLNVKNDVIPDENSFSGKVTLFGKSVNNAVGTAFDIRKRDSKFFYKIKGFFTDFGDYNIPTDTIIYLTRKIPIHNRRLKNTAGTEWNALGQIGYVSENYQTIFTMTNNRNKAGFFPGSHGIPNLNRLQDDGNPRNIGYPYQQTNHFTVQNSHKWKFVKSDFSIDVAYQNNHRQEISEFHTHFSNQSPPEKNPDVELDFNLHTINSNAKLRFYFDEKHHTDFGVQLQYQSNSIKGYNFLLPEYKRNNYGVFGLHHFRYSDKFRFNVGLRFDFSDISIKEYFDPILYEYLVDRNYTEDLASQYALRSPNLKRDFSNFNTKIGVLYSWNPYLDLALSAGSSFRNPTAIELVANGIHHGSFRHEKGNPKLDSEKGYSVDFEIRYKKGMLGLNVSSYLYYFSNYLFLRPTGEFSVLPHSGQLYEFSQTKVYLTGFELENTLDFKPLSTEIALEYIYNKQIEQNYPLPFTPPFNVFVKLNYTILEKHDTKVFVSGKYFAEQNRIAQNEEITEAALVFNSGISSSLLFGKTQVEASLMVQNIFDTRYFNHTSFYRALEIPEQGRNIQLMFTYKF
jgi:iron complex outermembrane receptor protein